MWPWKGDVDVDGQKSRETVPLKDVNIWAGQGKPLPNRVDYNPYADFTTHKINQILVEGGFAPEWVMLRYINLLGT